MKVILFGATGMVGQGVLRECLGDPGVERVLSVGRNPIETQHAKLEQLVHKNLTDYSAVEEALTGHDVCFFCLGVSSSGMTEADYRRVTYDIAVAAGRTLALRNPEMTFIFVSGAGTDSTGKGRSMWARVKGETENALLAMPFKAAYMFRPAYIQPMNGATSRTPSYKILHKVMGPLFPLWNALIPHQVTTTERVGRAMLQVAQRGAPKRVLENQDINLISADAAAASGAS